MKTCKSFARDGKGTDGRTDGLKENLDSLLRRYAKQARRFAYQLAGNDEEAEELVQQASYQVLRNWERYDPLQSFQSWYLTMVKRLFLDIRKSMSYWGTVPLNVKVSKKEGRDLEEVLADGEPGPLEQLERSEQADAARHMLEALNDEHKAVVTLCYIEGMSYEDAGEKLGIPTGTVRSRLFRARAALRRDPEIRLLA